MAGRRGGGGGGGGGGGDIGCCETKFWLFIAIILGLVSFAGLMAGLTLGLMSLGLVDLEVLIKSGRPPDRIHAAKIFPVVKNQHLLLCTLLIGNSLAMESLPIFLDKLVSPWAAILISVTLILMFGEILPQAICTRYGMTVGATLAPFVRVLLLLFFPIAYPISKMLDWLLGKGHSALLRRAELKTFVDFHGNAAGKGGDLTHDETTIIAGALELTEKTAKDAMTLISNTFSLDLDGTLDVWTLDSIMTKGHSRVPVYTGSPNNIIGLILVKNLLTIDPKDEVPLRKMVIRKIPRVSENMPLYDILNEFQKGQSHIAVVVKDSNERKESLKKPKEVKQLEPKLNIEKKRAIPNVNFQKTVPDVSLCPALGEQDGLRGPTNSGQITGITESGLNDSQAATMQHKDSDQQLPIKAPVLGTSVSKRRQKRSECILDVENTPLPTFSPSEEVVGVITMEDVIEELLQEEILDETDEYINIHNRIKVNMQASQRSNLPSKPSQPSLTLSSARTPTSTSPVSRTRILSEHSPASSYLIAPGPTPALSVSTSTAMTGSPVTFCYKASDGVSQRDS